MKCKLFSLLFLAFTILSCNNNANQAGAQDANSTSKPGGTTAPGRYDLSRPSRTWVLPDELKEISGNTWVDKDHLLVIEDLHPNLYLLRLDDKAIVEKTVPFEASSDKKVDIEDVTMVNNVVYALWSHGVIFKITNWQSKEHTEEITTFLDKKNNTEGICFDPLTNNLLIACKNKSDVDGEKKSTRAVYSFDMQKNVLADRPFMVMEKKDFKDAGDEVDIHPSAIAVHPVTHDIYVLSTKKTKCLVQYGHDGQFKSIQMIDKDQMPQPEGICFDPAGVLYISTEGKHGEPARLFQYN